MRDLLRGWTLPMLFRKRWPWLIEAFRRFEMPENLRNDFGYANLTDADKDIIFGKNLAKLYDVDVASQLTDIPTDSLTSMKSAYLDSGADPSHTQYGWVAV